MTAIIILLSAVVILLALNAIAAWNIGAEVASLREAFEEVLAEEGEKENGEPF